MTLIHSKIRIFVRTKNITMYKVRAILDTKEDVIRTLLIDPKKNLEDLHTALALSFGFDAKEMASFYRTEETWAQGEEIPLFNMAEAGEGLFMGACIIGDTLPKVSEKLIYVYDFLHMWTFYIEVVEVNVAASDEKIILSIGEIPKDVPEKEFKADVILDEFDEAETDDFSNFESLDDIDFDTY